MSLVIFPFLCLQLHFSEIQPEFLQTLRLLGPANFYNREKWNAGFRNYSDCVSAALGMSAELRGSRRSKPQGGPNANVDAGV